MHRKFLVCRELPPRYAFGAVSRIRTRAPSSAAVIAAQRAAFPPPTTTTSQLEPGVVECLFISLLLLYLPRISRSLVSSLVGGRNQPDRVSFLRNWQLSQSPNSHSLSSFNMRAHGFFCSFTITRTDCCKNVIVFFDCALSPVGLCQSGWP